MDTDRLPPDLEAALRALPRELAPSPDEEERTVRALRRRGLLPQPRWRRWAAAAGSLAAALALFAGGAFYGEARASGRALEAVLAQRDRDARATALLVQRAGSAYVTALVELAASARTSPEDPTLAQGREAALQTLRAATAQLERMAPAAAVNAGQRAAPSAAARPDARQLYWF